MTEVELFVLTCIFLIEVLMVLWYIKWVGVEK